MQQCAFIETNPRAQRIARFDEFTRKIYSRDPAPVSTGNEARSAAKATTNVENMFLSDKPELIEKIL